MFCGFPVNELVNLLHVLYMVPSYQVLEAKLEQVVVVVTSAADPDSASFALCPLSC